MGLAKHLYICKTNIFKVPVHKKAATDAGIAVLIIPF